MSFSRCKLWASHWRGRSLILVGDADLAREALVGEPSGSGAEVFDERIEGDDFVARGAVAGVIEGECRIARKAQCATE